STFVKIGPNPARTFIDRHPVLSALIMGGYCAFVLRAARRPVDDDIKALSGITRKAYLRRRTRATIAPGLCPRPMKAPGLQPRSLHVLNGGPARGDGASSDAGPSQEPAGKAPWLPSRLTRPKLTYSKRTKSNRALMCTDERP